MDIAEFFLGEADAEIARLTETCQKLSDALDKALGENEQMREIIRWRSLDGDKYLI